MATAEIRLSATVLGLLTGNRTFAPSVASYSAAHGGLSLVNLSNGNNTITVPTGATGVMIVPPSTNTAGIQLKGIAADTGVSLSPSSWQMINFGASPPATFVLTTTGAIAGVEFNWF